MKFTLILTTLSSAFGASCGILSSQGCVDMIIHDTYDIGNQTRNIGCIAAAIEPNCIFTMLKLQTTTNTLIESINMVGCAINSSCPSLALSDSLPLVPVLQSLAPTVARTMSILEKKKPVFDHSVFGVISLSWLVRNDLTLVLSAVEAMSFAIRSRVPESAHSIVEKISEDISSPIREARDLFAQP